MMGGGTGSKGRNRLLSSIPQIAAIFILFASFASGKLNFFLLLYLCVHYMNLAALSTCVFVLALYTGSHFRFGTISWRNMQTSSSQVTITMNLAFRRDYSWGQFFDESYSPGIIDGNGFPDGFLTDVFTFPEGTDYVGQTSNPWYIKFPVGRNFLGLDLAGSAYGSGPLGYYQVR